MSFLPKDIFFSPSYKRNKWDRKEMGENKFLLYSSIYHWLPLCFEASLVTTDAFFFLITNSQHTLQQDMRQTDSSECFVFILWFPRHTWPSLFSNFSFRYPLLTISLLSQWETFEWVNWHCNICQILILFSQLAVVSILYFNWLG